MLRKDMKFDWNNESKSAFTSIKDVITSAPVLAKLDFNKDFRLYTNATEQAISAILIQPDPDDYE